FCKCAVLWAGYSFFCPFISNRLFSPTLGGNGYVYETFGISKHFPVKLQVPLIQAETLNNPLTAKCFIYDVVCWALL
ncbi:hypothetical protein, partial [Alkalitalea saponilacus]|uniref:hypothetical protein n=1 Tax=Alkalitalea saponilacus TaxID=889453 RepID=UPI001F16790B